MSSNGFGPATDFPPLNGDDTNEMLDVYDLNVRDQFSISSLGLTNNQWEQLVGIRTDQTIQEQIDSLIYLTEEVGYNGVFYSTIDQTAAATNTIYTATFTTAYASNNGMILNDPLSTNYRSIKILEAATYNIQVILHISSTNSNTSELRAWIRKNGSDLSASSALQTINHNNSDETIAFNIIIPLQIDDVISVMWATNDTSMFFNYVPPKTTPYVAPLSPSVQISFMQVQYYQDNTAVVEALQTEVTDLSGNYYTFKNLTNTRLNDIETFDTAIQSQVNTISTDLDDLETEVTDLSGNYYPFKNTTNSRLTNIENFDTSIDSRVDTLETAVAATGTSVAALGVAVAANSTAIAGLSASVATLQTQVTAVQGDITDINADLTALQGKTEYQSTATNQTNFSGKLVVDFGAETINIDPALNKISAGSGQPLILAASNTLTLDANQVDVNSTSTINLNSTTGVNVVGTALYCDTLHPHSGTAITLSSGSSGTVNIGNSLDIVNINGFPFQSWLWVQW